MILLVYGRHAVTGLLFVISELELSRPSESACGMP